MNILFDEDVGTGVPEALRAVGYRGMVSLATREWLSWDDTDWLTHAGRNVWLVFSCNKDMLNVPYERDTIIRENVGIVFLTSGEEHSPKVLWLLLVKWQWLEEIDENVPRPFAFLTVSHWPHPSS